MLKRSGTPSGRVFPCLLIDRLVWLTLKGGGGNVIEVIYRNNIQRQRKLWGHGKKNKTTPTLESG